MTAVENHLDFARHRPNKANVMSPAQPFLLGMRTALCLLAMLTVTPTVLAQVIYESGVNVVTVVGKPGIPGDRDGTGEEVLLGNVRGVAALGEMGFVVSRLNNTTRIKKIVGRTVSTIAEFSSAEYEAIVGDPVRSSVLFIQGAVARRLSESGQILTTMPFVRDCSIWGNSVGIPQGSPHSLWLLDLQTGNSTYLAGGMVGNQLDGSGETAGFYSIRSTAAADGLVYVNDNGGLRVATFTGEVRTLVVVSGDYRDGDLTKVKACPRGPMVTDKDGNLIFAQDYSIRRLASNSVTTLAGSPGNYGNFDGDGFNARFSNIQGIAIDSANRLWVADENCVRLITFQESRKDAAAQISIRVVPGITVVGEVGGVYRIEYRDSLPGAGWQLLRVIVLAQPVEEFFDYEARGQERFYRVVVPQ